MWIFHDLSTSEIDWAKQCTFLAWCVLTFDIPATLSHLGIWFAEGGKGSLTCAVGA